MTGRPYMIRAACKSHHGVYRVKVMKGWMTARRHQGAKDPTDLLFEQREEATWDVLLGVDCFSVFLDVRAATICGFTSHSQMFDWIGATSSATSSPRLETRERKITHVHADLCACKRKRSVIYICHVFSNILYVTLWCVLKCGVSVTASTSVWLWGFRELSCQINIDCQRRNKDLTQLTSAPPQTSTWFNRKPLTLQLHRFNLSPKGQRNLWSSFWLLSLFLLRKGNIRSATHAKRDDS